MYKSKLNFCCSYPLCCGHLCHVHIHGCCFCTHCCCRLQKKIRCLRHPPTSCIHIATYRLNRSRDWLVKTKWSHLYDLQGPRHNEAETVNTLPSVVEQVPGGTAHKIVSTVHVEVMDILGYVKFYCLKFRSIFSD